MKALLLCAGLGKRLGPLTAALPKPMLPIQGKPLIAYNLEWLATNGYRDVAINLHFMPETIQAFVGDGARFGLHVRYSREKELLGTGGTAKNLRELWLDEEHVLVAYGDLLINQNLKGMLESHRRRDADATLLLHRSSKSNSVVEMASDFRISRFLERPTDRPRLADAWANSGVYMLRPSLLDALPPGPSDFAKDLFESQCARRRFYGYPLDGYRCAIDSPQRYDQAQEDVRQGRLAPPRVA